MSDPYRPLFDESTPVAAVATEAKPVPAKPSQRDALLPVIKEILRDRGVRLLGNVGQEILHSEELDGWRIRLGLPIFHVGVEFGDVRNDDGEWMMKAIDTGIAQLCQANVDHISKHWRDPLDRLTKIEAAAQAVCDKFLDKPTDGSSMGELVFVLFELLRSKPGAVSYHLNGFGKDPKR